MKNKLIMSLGSLLLIAALAVGTATVMAEENTSSSVSKFSSKVAAILGLDEQSVENAINQARKELITEMGEKKLGIMAEKGLLTKAQAAEKLRAFTSHAESTDKQKKRTNARKRFEYLKNKASYNKEKMRGWTTGKKIDVEEWLNGMVQKGLLSEEQADAKLQHAKNKSKGE
jgi:hypothetical protein